MKQGHAECYFDGLLHQLKHLLINLKEPLLTHLKFFVNYEVSEIS